MDPFGYLTKLAVTLALIGGAIFYEFMREGAEVYGLPMARAHALLKAGTRRITSSAADRKTFDVDARDPGKIVWIVKDDGREAMRFAALLSPVDAASTKVRVEVTGPTSGPFGDVQRRLAEYRTVRHLYAMAAKENVAATLEGRKFNFTAVMPATTLATLSAVFRMAAEKDGKPAAVQEATRSDRAPQSADRAIRR